MKKILTLLLLPVSAIFFAQCDNHSWCRQKDEFRLRSISSDSVVWIKKIEQGNAKDTIMLNPEEIHDFITKFNASVPDCMYKYMYEQWVFVGFRNGTARNFRINGSLIKEDSDYCMISTVDFF